MTTLQGSYDSHPLNAASIRQRLSRQGRTKPTELDLALDQETFITDQNHVGGLACVIQLAETANVTRQSVVCDVGGGLGGPARSLAYFFGCAVHVVDVHEGRCRDAAALSEQVGLQTLVSIECLDATTTRTKLPFDVLWGQSAWSHFDNLETFLKRWSETLRVSGVVACEDVFLKRPATKTEVAALQELKNIWHCHIWHASDWRRWFQAAALEMRAWHDLTFLLASHFDRLLRSAQEPQASERHGWRLAITLTEGGLLGYARWLAMKQPSRLSV